jgi:cysteinyl-tRNA synthetase
MAMHLLGPQIDIHTGGQDNIFPHHEDERAQSESLTGKPFARYWMHNGFLQLAEEKMSKSLGNIYTVSDLEEHGIRPLTYRYFTFQAHYRTPLTFSWDALGAAQTALFRVWEQMAELVQSTEPEEVTGEGLGLSERFHVAINNDLDMPTALAVLHETLGARLADGQKLALAEDFDRVLGLKLIEMGAALSDISEDEQAVLSERAAVREAKNWARSDELRNELAGRGLDVRDTSRGQRWVRRDLLR